MHFGFRAVPTGDHPPERSDSEGVIAAGEYGGGTVIAWDEGGYRPLTDGPFAQALEHGHASFRLDGSKLYGGCPLTRPRGGPDRMGCSTTLTPWIDMSASRLDA